jgi:hypothetical protein
MVTAARVRELAMSFHDVTAAPHFDRIAFRTPRRIFTTMAADGTNANVRISPPHQDLVCASAPDVVMKLNGAWGANGWVRVELSLASEQLVKELLADAFARTAEASANVKKKTAKKVNGQKKTGSISC